MEQTNFAKRKNKSTFAVLLICGLMALAIMEAIVQEYYNLYGINLYDDKYIETINLLHDIYCNENYFTTDKYYDNEMSYVRIF